MDYQIGSLSNLISKEYNKDDKSLKLVVTEYKLKDEKLKKRKDNPTLNIVNDNIRKVNRKSKNLKKKAFKEQKNVIINNLKSVNITPNKKIDSSNEQTNKEIKDTRNPEEDERTIFVGNWPIKHDKKYLKTYFSQYGEVVTTRFRSIPIADTRISKKVTAITKQFHPDRTSVNAYVKFSEKESVNKALAANGNCIDNHHLRVTPCNNSLVRDLNKSIFIGNLSFQSEEDDLWRTFLKCGEIESVRIIRDSKTGISKGIGYVNFKKLDGVELALKMDSTELNGRNLRIKRIDNKTKRKQTTKNNPANQVSNVEAYQRRKEKKNKNFQGIKVNQKQKNKRKSKEVKRLNNKKRKAQKKL